MREVVIKCQFEKDNPYYFKPNRGFLVQFIVSPVGQYLGIVEMVDGSIKAFPISNIYYKYPASGEN
jgi:hypothetical protein